VSKATSVTVRALYKLGGRTNTGRDRKTATEGVEVTCSGRLFQTRAAATGKAPSPTVDSRVRKLAMTSSQNEVADELRHIILL